MKRSTATMKSQLLLLAIEPALPAWERYPGASGGTCGEMWIHTSGWKVQHCGHPTANWPYYLESPEGLWRIAKNGRGFRHLIDAKGAVELIASGADPESCSVKMYAEDLEGEKAYGS